MNSGQLTVKPTCAKLKYDSEWFGKMDPYVILTIGSQKYKTHAAKDAGKNPSWTDQFTFAINGESQMNMKIYDKDFGSRDDFIAEGSVSLMQVMQMGQVSEWFPLTRKGKNAGQIMLIMNFMGSNQGYGQGYPPQGYNQGYPPQGYGQGYPPQGYGQGYPPQGYPPQGYPPQGYPPQGYNQGYPPQGYGQGYPPQGGYY